MRRSYHSRIKNFPKISQFRKYHVEWVKNTINSISTIQSFFLFFFFQRLRRFKTFLTVCILISHPRRCIASAQQVTRFKIVNISFDDRIRSKFACYTLLLPEEDLRQFLKSFHVDHPCFNIAVHISSRDAFEYRAILSFCYYRFDKNFNRSCTLGEISSIYFYILNHKFILFDGTLLYYEGCCDN